MNRQDVDSDDEIETMPFEGLEKAAVLQQTREFNAVTVKARKCSEIMVNVLYLIHTGHTMTETEATEVFFAATKLFQSDDDKLRRLLYVLLKELTQWAQQCFAASSSLMRDINSQNEMFRGNAIRTLRTVLDPSMVASVERFLRQAVVDKNDDVVASALTTGLHLFRVAPDTVKRWGPEVSNIAKSRGGRCQYHGLALLHQIRKNDRLSVLKLVREAREGPIRSPLALCLLVKLRTEYLQEDFAGSTEMYQFVNSMTHNSSDMVVFEAARCLSSIKGISAKEIQPAVLVLQLYLNSHRAPLRFASVRLLNRIATQHPSVVASCHMELETMVHDPNRGIGTLAITTLLKSGGEHNIDRVLGVVSNFMDELGEDGKMVIVDALKILAAKFPEKYPSLINFLTEILTEEGSADLKLVIVETLVSLMKSNPNAVELALFRLCEYIEDCEYNGIINRILTVVGQEGPATSNPGKYVRYINNRIVLDKPAIRAVGVATLAKLGAANVALRPRICVLLERASRDVDDDVRDRAVFYRKVLGSNDEYIIRNLIPAVGQEVSKERTSIDKAPARLRAATDATDAKDIQMAAESVSNAASLAESAANVASGGVSLEVQQLRDRMRKIPQLREIEGGEPIHSTPAINVTEPDCEYYVQLVKHVFSEHIVLQYKFTNTMEDAAFKNVVVQADVSELEVEPLFAIPAASIAPGENQCVYVVLKKNAGEFPAGGVSHSCNFAMHETGEDEAQPAESYDLEDFAMNVSDYIAPQPLPDFDGTWESLAGEEISETYALESMKTLTEAQNEVVDFYGMDIVGGKPGNVTSRSSTIKMSGSATLDKPTLVLVTAKVFITQDQKIALTLTLRSANQELREFLCAALVS